MAGVVAGGLGTGASTGIGVWRDRSRSILEGPRGSGLLSDGKFRSKFNSLIMPEGKTLDMVWE